MNLYKHINRDKDRIGRSTHHKTLNQSSNFMLFLLGSKYNRHTNNILSCSNWFLPAFIFSDHWLNQFNGVLFTPALWIMSMTHVIFSSQRHCLSTDMREGTTPDFWWDFCWKLVESTLSINIVVVEHPGMFLKNNCYCLLFSAEHRCLFWLNSPNRGWFGRLTPVGEANKYNFPTGWKFITFVRSCFQTTH